jgi:muconolactone delta-isomerase
MGGESPVEIEDATPKGQAGGGDFLVRMRSIDPIPLTMSELGRLAQQQLDYWDDLMARGKVVYTAPFVGRRARIAIYRVESNAELFQLINQDPLFVYLEREVVPLASNEQLRELYAGFVTD